MKQSRLNTELLSRLITVVIYVLVLNSGTPINAQTNKSNEAITSTVKQAIELHLEELLRKHIPAEHFAIDVNLTMDPASQSAKDQGYLPSEQVDISLAKNLSLPRLMAMCANVDVTLYLVQGYPPQSRAWLSKLLKDKSTTGNKSINVKIETLNLQIPPKSNPELEKALRDMETLKQEKNESYLQTILNFFRELFNQSQSFIQKIGIGVLVALLIMFFTLLFFVGAVRSIGKSIGSMAGALESLGGHLSVDGSGMLKEANLKLDHSNEDAESTSGAKRGQGGTPYQQELQSRLLTLHEELVSTLSDKSESVIIRHITNILNQTGGSERAVVTLELLGKETANAIFRRLGQFQQSKILQFFSSGEFSKSKAELMLEAGEELKTKLMGMGFEESKGLKNSAIIEKILALNEAGILTIMRELDELPMAHLFLNLEPAHALQLLQKLKSIDGPSFDKAMGAVSHLSDAKEKKDAEKQLQDFLNDYMKKQEADEYREIVPWYKAILEKADDEFAEEILGKLDIKQDVKSVVSENLVTFKQFFSLDEALRKSIIDALSNKHVAGLIALSPEEAKPGIWECLNSRRLDIVKEETETIAEMPAQRAQPILNNVRAAVVTKLRELRKAGLLTVTRSSEDETPSDVEPLKKAA